MSKQGSIIAGILLILCGIFFITVRPLPFWLDSFYNWPFMIITGVGLAFILAALISGLGPLAIPGCIIAGIGLLLLWQNATGNFESWAYAWTLVPGMVGAGLVLSSLIGPHNKSMRITGFYMAGISCAVFMMFLMIFRYHSTLFLPILLIIAGALLMLKNIVRR